MTLAHKIVLWGLLGLLGLSLLVPGLMNVVRKDEGTTWLIAETVDAKNHLRALNAMMAALGAVALWACWDVERARLAVIGLGVVMAALVVARAYSIVVDGWPSPMTLVYLACETVMAVVFLAWPPPG
ncbi:MAG: DUF4345 domain-containing protein [Rhodospirillales bacterium]|nr:DUF4345 domain-containing protein [Rhodospirillales bacterium]